MIYLEHKIYAVILSVKEIESSMIEFVGTLQSFYNSLVASKRSYFRNINQEITKQFITDVLCLLFFYLITLVR